MSTHAVALPRRRRTRSSRVGGIALFALVSLLCGELRAQRGLPIRDIEVRWEEGTPRVSFGARELIDAAARRSIDRGVTRRVRVTVQAFREGASDPIASRSFICGLTFDVWDRTYHVRLGRQTHRFETMDAALGKCLNVRGLRVGEGRNYLRVGERLLYFAVRAEFNPISRSRCRELLGRSSGEGALFGPVVVNIVRRQICRADRAIEFRSRARAAGR